jgi:hypothetical protein
MEIRELEMDNRITNYTTKDVMRYIEENDDRFYNQFQAAGWLIGTFANLDRTEAMRLYRTYQNNLHGKWEKGQSLVEFALFVVMGFLSLLLIFDATLFALNVGLAGISSFNASRAASIFYAGDGTTCAGNIEIAGNVTDPIGPGSWQRSTTPCPDDPYWVPPSGALATSVVTVTYHPMFVPGDPWVVEVVIRNSFE